MGSIDWPSLMHVTHGDTSEGPITARCLDRAESHFTAYKYGTSTKDSSTIRKVPSEEGQRVIMSSLLQSCRFKPGGLTGITVFKDLWTIRSAAESAHSCNPDPTHSSR
jgi:hypothetical protein